MRILVVDDETLALESLMRLLEEVCPEAERIGFSEATAALDYLETYGADVMLLDIMLGTSSGMELAQRCKAICAKVNIIFVTGYDAYAVTAHKLRVSGYLMKPVRASDLREELDNLRNPLPLVSTQRVRIQTFGNFEIFVDQAPLILSSSKAKECLAYLVDRRGGQVTYAELYSVLWGDKPYDRAAQNNMHQTVRVLMHTLKKVKAEKILIRTRLGLALNVETVDCDYYAALRGDVTQLNTFTGEYMSQYSWGEVTLGALLFKTKL